MLSRSLSRSDGLSHAITVVASSRAQPIRGGAEDTDMRTALYDVFRSRGHTLLFAVVVLQGFHELEHIIQVVQRYVLEIPNGNGLLGSVVDFEPLHFSYNT